MSAGRGHPGIPGFVGVQSGTDCSLKPGALVRYAEPESFGADFAFNVHALRFVQFIAVSIALETILRGHLDAEIVATAGIQPRRSSSRRLSSKQRDVRTPSTWQLFREVQPPVGWDMRSVLRNDTQIPE